MEEEDWMEQKAQDAKILAQEELIRVGERRKVRRGLCSSICSSRRIRKEGNWFDRISVKQSLRRRNAESRRRGFEISGTILLVLLVVRSTHLIHLKLQEQLQRKQSRKVSPFLSLMKPWLTVSSSFVLGCRDGVRKGATSTRTRGIATACRTYML